MNSPTSSSGPDYFEESRFASLWSLAHDSEAEVSGRERRELKEEEKLLIQRVADGEADAEARLAAARLMAHNSAALEYFVDTLRSREPAAT